MFYLKKVMNHCVVFFLSQYMKKSNKTSENIIYTSAKIKSDISFPPLYFTLILKSYVIITVTTDIVT